MLKKPKHDHRMTGSLIRMYKNDNTARRHTSSKSLSTSSQLGMVESISAIITMYKMSGNCAQEFSRQEENTDLSTNERASKQASYNAICRLTKQTILLSSCDDR
ncbi:secretin receptor [Trichinella spiralis]|uniref:secretin receptor n=1 Tax=Trichinella spiralis TaxID=6334 RepID=UPI0001EFC42C|nr:secretin receptor [Trichinella spiralis]